MPSKKSKRKVTTNIIDPKVEKKTTPRTAKIVLFVFGVGPLLLMCLFLFSNGFFNSPWQLSNFKQKNLYVDPKLGANWSRSSIVFFLPHDLYIDRYINHLFCLYS